RMVLIDHVVVENLADFLGRRDAVPGLHQRGLVLLADDVHAQFDAFVADEDRRPGDELAHLVLALAAERAIERVLRIAAADFTHSFAPVDSAWRICCLARTWRFTWRLRASLKSHPGCTGLAVCRAADQTFNDP